MVDSKGEGKNSGRDPESQEQPINPNSQSSSETPSEGPVRAWRRFMARRAPSRSSSKVAEAARAQAQAEEFWRKIYSSMKSVESREQAETLFKGLSSSNTPLDDGAPAKIEVQGEHQPSEDAAHRASALRARAPASEGLVEVKVDPNDSDFLPYNADKLAEPHYPKRRNLRKCSCCNPGRLWCCLTLSTPVLLIVLVLYFLAFTPKAPSTVLENVSISGFEVLEGADGAPRIATAMNFTVRLKNPNRFAHVVYAKLEVLLMFGGTAVGSVSVGVSGYKQQERNLTLIEVHIPATNTSISEGASARELHSEVANRNVRMLLMGLAQGHFRVLGLNWGNFDTPVNCLLNVRPQDSRLPAALLSASCYNLPR